MIGEDLLVTNTNTSMSMMGRWEKDVGGRDESACACLISVVAEEGDEEEGVGVEGGAEGGSGRGCGWSYSC